jgi:hypothetical protein
VQHGIGLASDQAEVTTVASVPWGQYDMLTPVRAGSLGKARPLSSLLVVVAGKGRTPCNRGVTKAGGKGCG